MDESKKKRDEIELFTVSASDLQGVSSSLDSLNTYAAGIGYALGDSLLNYNEIVSRQKEALASVQTLGQSIDTGQLHNLVGLYQEAMSPLSSVIADVGVMNASVNKLYEAGEIAHGYLDITENFSALAVDSILEQQELLQNSLDVTTAISGVEVLSANIAPQIQTISSGLSEMIRSLGTLPTLDTSVPENLESVRETAEIEEEELLDHQKRLDAVLNEIDPELVTFRRGVWATFNAKGDDYIGQASSSMRRLVDNLLRALAPEEQVRETRFFQTSPHAQGDNGKPTRKAKVFYIVNWDEEKTEHVKRLTTGFLEEYQNLSAWDHVPLNKDMFVHGALIAIEGHLLAILSVNRGT